MSDTPIGDKLPEVAPSGQTRLFTWLAGRTTSFLAFFALMGTAMHWAHRLDPTYITFIGVIMGFVLGHSIKEDVAAKQADK